MSLFHTLTFVIATLAVGCVGRESRQAVQSNDYRAVAYYGDWDIYQREYFPADLPVTQLTHVMYAFAQIDGATGEVHLSDETADINTQLGGELTRSGIDILDGCLGELYALKSQNRNLKVLLSIEGAKYSTNFSSAVCTDSGRALFASSALSLVKKYGFDGIDINWQYPQDTYQAGNLTLLLKEVRNSLDQYGDSLTTGYHFELSYACSAGPANYQRLHISDMNQYLDFWNLMAYDYVGPWSNATGHHANLFSAGNVSTPFNTKAVVTYYVSNGATSQKLVLGMPLYGRSFNRTTGLGESFVGVGQGGRQKGIYDFKSLPLAGAREIYDETVGASYSWNEETRELVSYDTVASARQKALWIQAMGLGEGMWWEGSANRNGSNSLIHNVVEVFGDSIQQSPNNLEYPDSPYTNVGGRPSVTTVASTSCPTSCDSSTTLLSTTPLSAASTLLPTISAGLDSTSTSPTMDSSSNAPSLASSETPTGSLTTSRSTLGAISSQESSVSTSVSHTFDTTSCHSTSLSDYHEPEASTICIGCGGHEVPCQVDL